METNNNMEHSKEGKIISSIKKENSFSVPLDYFEMLPEKTMNRIHQSGSNQKQPFFIFKSSFIIPSLTIFSGLIILLVLLFTKNENVPGEMLLSENEVQQVVDYPELYNINDAIITEQYIALNISDESMNYETAVSENEIKDYLEENPEATKILNEY